MPYRSTLAALVLLVACGPAAGSSDAPKESGRHLTVVEAPPYPPIQRLGPEPVAQTREQRRWLFEERLEERELALLRRIKREASFRLGHVNLDEGYVDQDAREVRTKFSKTFRTFLMPIGGDALAIFADWIRALERDHHWGGDDPLFPATQMGLDDNGGFRAAGISRSGWSTTQPVNAIFRRAFEAAGLPYFNPHSFRDMLVRHAMTLDLSPESMKAWSQNLGHSDVLTTFTSYGAVPAHRQGELIRAAREQESVSGLLDDPDVLALISAIQAKGNGGLRGNGR